MHVLVSTVDSKGTAHTSPIEIDSRVHDEAWRFHVSSYGVQILIFVSWIGCSN